MFYMGQSQKSIAADLRSGDLADLSSRGAYKHRLALGALGCLSNVKDGRRLATHPYFGKVQRRGDFATRGLTIARFHCHVIDIGDSIPLKEALLRTAGHVENVERN